MLAIQDGEINELDSSGKTALHHATEYGETELVSLLLAHGADVDVVDGAGEKALAYAVYNNNTEIVSMFLAHGVHIDDEVSEGKTMLVNACENMEESLVEFLLNKGADPMKVINNDSVYELLMNGDDDLLPNQNIITLLHKHKKDSLK